MHESKMLKWKGMMHQVENFLHSLPIDAQNMNKAPKCIDFDSNLLFQNPYQCKTNAMLKGNKFVIQHSTTSETQNTNLKKIESE